MHSFNFLYAQTGEALDFDGSNDWVEIDAIANDIAGKDYTVSFWMKQTGTSGTVDLFAINTASKGNRMLLEMNNSTGIIDVYNTGISASLAVNDGNWHYITFTMGQSDSAATLYIDGMYQSTGTVEKPIPGDRISLGQEWDSSPSNFFQGEMDEVSIWNRVLSRCEIDNNMKGELPSPGTQDGLVAYYQFNQGTAGGSNSGNTILTDVSGNGLDGTLTNFALTGTGSNWVAPGMPNSNTTAPAYTPPGITNFTANSNSPVIVGNTIQLMAPGGATSYQWTSLTGKAGFTSSQEDPIISSSLYSDAGEYAITVVDPSGCKFYDTITVGVTINTQNTLYVDTNVNQAAPGYTGDGLSWANAMPRLSDALKFARPIHWSEDGPLKIYVARGTYKPLYSAGDTAYTSNGDRNNAFVIPKDVQLYGGFDPANGIDDLNDSRIFDSIGTILSGNIGVADDSDNCYHVVISAGDAGNALLDGFIITGGNADSIVTDTVMVNGNAFHAVAMEIGGGMLAYQSSPALSHLTFSNNYAAYKGGGLANLSSSSTITNCTFKENSAYGGGGIYNSSSNPVLTNVTITHNKALDDGGGISNYESSPVLTNVSITNNNQPGSGCVGGGMYSEQSSSSTLTNVDISGNYGSYGGGVSIDGSHPSFKNVIISGNTATERGGGLYKYSYSASSGDVFINVAVFGNTAAQGGGGMYLQHVSPTMINVTIAGNTANQNGGGLYTQQSAHPNFYNSIIYGNSVDSAVYNIYNYSATPTFKNSLVGGSAAWNATKWGTDGGNNIAIDSGYINTIFADTASGDYALKFGSYAINAGSDSLYALMGDTISGLDVSDYYRVVHDTIDMGAYEFQFTHYNTLNPAICQGDAFQLPGGKNFYTSGTYFVDTIAASVPGWDSVTVVNLTVTMVDVSVTNNSPTLKANASGASYRWLDCANNFAVIAGETSQNFVVTQNGSYAVEVTQSGCADTSACIMITSLGISNGIMENRFKIYPNPSTGQFTINAGGLSLEAYTIRIINTMGETVYRSSFTEQLDLQQLSKGVYTLMLENEKGNIVKQIIIQ